MRGCGAARNSYLGSIAVVLRVKPLLGRRVPICPDRRASKFGASVFGLPSYAVAGEFARSSRRPGGPDRRDDLAGCEQSDVKYIFLDFSDNLGGYFWT